jgi:alkanesulfonate monooxygenase SsuD/methylene tetrahydromethanopterin reductase-like flavin-dependent oxidoreductase (luciferase family)
LTDDVSNSERGKFRDFLKLFQAKAHETGREVELGQHVCPVREIIVGSSYDEAFEIAVKGPGQVFYDYFQHFGFMENWRIPSDDPDNVPLKFDSAEALAQRWIDTDFIIFGTVDEVTEQLAELRDGYGLGAHVEHIAYQQSGQGAPPPEVTMQQLEIIGTQILPKLQ